MDAIASLRTPSRLRPALPCVLAPLLFALAPACLAQHVEVRGAAEPGVEQTDPAADAESAERKPRSAFGRVMSLMIAALQENAERPQPAGLAPEEAPEVTQPAGDGVQQIQVSAAFRLDAPQPAPPKARASAAPLAGTPDGD